MPPTPAVHPIALVRRRISDGNLQPMLLAPLADLVPAMLRHSRRGARLAERLSGDRPQLTLSSALAELAGQVGDTSQRRGPGLPRLLVDKCAFALHGVLDDRGTPAAPVELQYVAGTIPEPVDQALRHLDKAVSDFAADLARRGGGREEERRAVVRRRSRVTIDDGPPAGFFYTEDQRPVPTGMLLGIDLDDGPLAFVGVRGPVLGLASQCYAAERILDVIREPIFDELPRLKRLGGGRFGALLAALDELVIVDEDRPRLGWALKRSPGAGLELIPVARGSAAALPLPTPAKRTPRAIDDVVRQLPYATEQDRSIAQALLAHGRADGPAARALVDHPFVEADDGRPLRVLEVAPQIDVRDNGALAISARGLPVDADALSDAGATVAIHPQKGQAFVVVADAQEKALARAVVQLDGKPLPDRQLADVVARLKRGRLDIDLPERLRGRRVDADHRLLVKVALQAPPLAKTSKTSKTSKKGPKADDDASTALATLAAGGARFTVVSRPLPGGASYAPGEGPRLAFADAGDGQSHWCERDLEAERRAAGRVFAACDVGDEDVDGPFSFMLLSGERAVAAVGLLAQRDDVVVAVAGADIRVKSAKASDLRVSFAHKTDWLGIEGEVHLDHETRASIAAVLEALRAGRRYVVLDSSVLWLDDSLQDALGALVPFADTRSKGKGKRDDVQIPMAAASLVDDALQGPRDRGAVVEGRALTASARQALDDVDDEPPAGLQATLRPYQRAGLRFLRRLVALGTGGVLADDMGLGKTLTTIALLLDRRRQSDQPQLVVAPTSLGFHWHDEITRFAGRTSTGTGTELRPITLHDQPPDERRRRWEAAGAGDVLIASYGTVLRDAELLGKSPLRFSTLVVDEAQAVKNAATARAQALRELRCEWRLALTGTPVENHTGELWAILDLVAPGLFGTQQQWKSRFADPIDRDGDEVRRRRLAVALQPFVLRRRKTEVAKDLPEKTEVVHRLPPTAEERERYEHLRLAVIADLEAHGALPQQKRQPASKRRPDIIDFDPGQLRVQILAALTRLRLCACHPGLTDDVADLDTLPAGTKQRALVHVLDEVAAAGHASLVFSQFVRHLKLAERHAQAAGLRTLRLTGDTPAAERQSLVQRFQAGEADAFFISLRAGGFGLNLTRASTVVHLDPWWNPAVEDQASDRAHRIGQQLPVTVIRLITEGTLEDDVLTLHERKRALAEALLEGADAGDKVSVDELLALVHGNRRHVDHDIQQAALPFGEGGRRSRVE